MRACYLLNDYWGRVPLSCHYDGEKEVARQLPFSIELFRKLNWPATKLLRIQKARVAALLKQLEDKNIKQYDRDWLIFEIKENLAVLQKLLDPTAVHDADSR